MSTFGRVPRREVTDHDYERCRVGKRYRAASLEKIPDKCEYKEKIKKFIDDIVNLVNSGAGLYLTGPYGGGKTSASVIVLREVIALGGSALMLMEQELINEVLEGSKSRWGDTEEGVLERAQAVDLLVIDDLGLSKPGMEHIVEAVLKLRMGQQKSIVINTNMMSDRFRERYRTVQEAIRESCLTVICGGHDWRADGESDLRNKLS